MELWQFRFFLVVWVTLCCQNCHGVFDFWNRNTAPFLETKLEKGNIFDVYYGTMVDVMVAFAMDSPIRLGILPKCSWQKVAQTTKGNEKVMQRNQYGDMQTWWIKSELNSPTFDLTVLDSGVIYAKGRHEIGWKAEYNMYPLYNDKEEGVFAFVERNIAQVKPLSRLTKRHATYITVRLEKARPPGGGDMTVATWNSVLRALEKIKSLKLPVLLVNAKWYTTLCSGFKSYDRFENVYLKSLKLKA